MHVHTCPPIRFGRSSICPNCGYCPCCHHLHRPLVFPAPIIVQPPAPILVIHNAADAAIARLSGKAA